MDVRQLKYFVHVTELGSFSKVAAFLSVAQPALSRQVRNLEGELGVTLLHRNGRGVTATEAGTQLLAHAKSILEQVERARNEVMALSGQPTGAATLGLPPTVSQVLITPLIKHVRRHYPAVSLQVVEGFSGHIHEWLAAGRLDVAVLYNAPRTKHLAAEPLLQEELFLITATTGKLADAADLPLAELADVPLILPSRPHGLRILVDTAAAAAEVPLRVDFEVDALPAIKELVEDGTASTILPFAAVYREVRDDRLIARRIVDPVISRTLVLATSTQRPLSLAARALVPLIKAEVRDLVATGKWLGRVRPGLGTGTGTGRPDPESRLP